MEKILEEKGFYRLIVGTSTEDNELCYKIIHNEHGVVEAETRILPQAYKFLEDLSAALDASIALEEEDSIKPHGNVYVLRGDKK